MKDLMRCPFCGSSDEPKAVPVEGESGYTVVCDASSGTNFDADPYKSYHHKGCGASTGYSETKERAIEKWNYRESEEANKCNADYRAARERWMNGQIF